MSAIAPYPLVLEPVLFEKVWGGRRLARLGKQLPKADAKYGESWELADLGATSASGAGGGAVRSRIVNGAMAGRTVAEAWQEWGEGLIARAGTERRPTTSASTFPLLIKFLDASENLSVQVHPSPTYAASHPGAHLKTECWYVLDAEPGSSIYKGLREGVKRAEFERAAKSGDGRALVAMLEGIPAVRGEMHNLPSGTVHALGAGVMVAEVQTPSDTTFRLYDWGRQGREMHVEQALACASFAGEPGHSELLRGMTVARLGEGELCARLVETEFFTVDELRPLDGDEVTIGYSCGSRHELPAHPRHGCFALVVLGGEGELRARDGAAFEPVHVHTGDTVLVPAAIAAAAALRAGPGLRVVRVGV